MRRLLVYLVTVISMAVLVAAGCTQAAPAPAPTQAPAAPAKPADPAKAAEPTKAPAAQPTAAPAPAKKVDFPQKGKPITFIVPFGAGGSTDVGARTSAMYAEKELGTTIQVVNRTGAGSQVGITEFVDSYKPDGYGLVGANLPGPITIMLNPDRKATFKRADLQPIAMHVVDPAAIAVAANGPYKSVQDLVNAAKANPGKIKAATTGLLSDDHLEILDVERATGSKFAVVHFDTGPEREPALLGGKIDASFGNMGAFYNLTKQGQVRVLAIMDKQRYKWLPDVPTLEQLGIKSYGASARGFYTRGGTPKEIVDILADAFKKAINNPEALKKMEDVGLIVRYMGPAEVDAYWTEVEAQVTPLMKQALSEIK